MESDGRGKRPRGAGSNRAGDASGSGSGSEQLAIDAAAKPQEEVISDAAEPDLAVVIRGGARRFLVNRSVLALCSLTLRSMMQDCRLPMSASGDYEELRLDDNESPSLRLFLRLMYPRDVGLMGDDQTILDMEGHIPAVIRLADKYNAPGIIVICEDILIRILAGIMTARRAPNPSSTTGRTWPELNMVKHAARIASIANKFGLSTLSVRCAEFLEQSPVDVVRSYTQPQRAEGMEQLGSVVLSRVLNSYVSSQTTRECGQCHARICPRCGCSQMTRQRLCSECNLPNPF